MSFNLSNEFFFLFFLFSIVFSYSIVRISKKIFKGQLLDKDFSKPQAFHHQATARVGGLVFFFLFLIFIFIFFKIYDYFLIDYFLIASSFFILGFLDDLKVKISPNYRLIIMLMILVFSINIFSIEINRSGLAFLNYWLENNIFQLCFVLLCFLFIINGSNLIDGFNGLLVSHFIIITLIYYFINLNNQNINFSNILLIQVIIAVSIFFFNFPKAKFFLGDSGSYLIGSLIALNTIKTYELNFFINPMFFATLLFYLFFEVFFSFIRKLFLKKSPLEPDRNHLHMLLYSFLSNYKKKETSNYLTSILINLIYITLIVPVIFFKENGLICRLYFFLLILIYVIIYIKLNLFKKKIKS